MLPLAPIAFGEGYKKAVNRVPKPSAPSNLRITDVKCAYSGGGLFVKIYTNQGIWGSGEGVDAVSGTYFVVKQIGQRLKGQNPLNPNRIAEQLRKANFFGGAQSGMYVAVLSAIEAALWDLTGKALGLPVYQLLGGKFRDKCRVYCDTELYTVIVRSPVTMLRLLPMPLREATLLLNLTSTRLTILINMIILIGQPAMRN
jgi:galactonate dehydratase